MGYRKYDRTELDARIQSLREDGLSGIAIAQAIGCSTATVYETLDPEKRGRYNARRREYARQRARRDRMLTDSDAGVFGASK